jgi:UDP:flavonoid glycosyltransferase YjiC (YdhE family)
MLIVPFGWDQPDNGARIERAGAGLMLSRKQYSADAAARMMRRLIMEPGYAKRAAEFAARMQGEHAVTSACDAIEDVLSRKRHGNTR